MKQMQRSVCTMAGNLSFVRYLIVVIIYENKRAKVSIISFTYMWLNSLKLLLMLL